MKKQAIEDLEKYNGKFGGGFTIVSKHSWHNHYLHCIRTGMGNSRVNINKGGAKHG